MQTDVIARLATWLASGDTGVSSCTLALVAMGATKGHFDAPHDMDDFGRCYRLVEAAPVLREHFEKVGYLVPAFARILANWDSLAEQYLKAQSSRKRRGEFHEMAQLQRDFYERLQSLRNEAKPA